MANEAKREWLGHSQKYFDINCDSSQQIYEQYEANWDFILAVNVHPNNYWKHKLDLQSWLWTHKFDKWLNIYNVANWLIDQPQVFFLNKVFFTSSYWAFFF